MIKDLIDHEMLMIYSESPITELAIPTQEYVAGYGIGKLSRADLETIIKSLEKAMSVVVDGFL